MMIVIAVRVDDMKEEDDSVINTYGQSWGSYFMKVIYYILLVTFTKK